MPKEFQKHNRVVSGGNKSGMVVMVMGVVLLLVVGGGFYLFFFQAETFKNLMAAFSSNQPANKTAVVKPVVSPVAPVTPPATAETSTMPIMSPLEIYKAFNEAIAVANFYEDYYQAVAKYGSENLQAAVKADKAIVELSPESAQKKLNEIKLNTPSLTDAQASFEILPDAKSATVKYVLVDGASSGTIDMLLENEAWRVNNEAWTIKPVIKTPEVYKPCEDRDSDQLCDKEEALLGTKNDSVDSDNDGYSDGQEVINLYNPMGTNKLVESMAINQYRNPELAFSVLAPTKSDKWKPVSSGSTEGSVTFNSDDGQFFQVISNLNASKESVDQYYLRIMDAGSINESQRIHGDNWDGIWTNDGLKVYIEDVKKKRIYVLQYGPGEGKTLDYLHLFQAMVKSFVAL